MAETSPPCADCGGHIQVGEGLTTYLMMHEHGGSRVVCADCWEVARVNAAQRQHEAVNHPPHYNTSPSGVECIDVVEWLPFNVGNAIKYLWRSEHKNGIEDLEKSIWYIRREIDRLQKLHKDAW